MIHSMAIKNFKSIRELELKPLGKLNIFIGPNNSGKSSILQAIAFLAQSVQRSIQYKGRYVDVGSFNEVIFTGKTKNNLGIELWFSLAEEMKGYHWREKFDAWPLLTKFEVEIGQAGILKQILESPTNKITCSFCRKEVNGTRAILKFNGMEVLRARARAQPV